MTDFLVTGPSSARTSLMLAHGAGAAMDSKWMDEMAELLAGHGIRVVRFEFAYMAARRQGERRPPPRAETVIGEYRAAVDALGSAGLLFIGGKSMGGRVASMVADELFAAGAIAGAVCLGYPFHPPGQPGRLRTAHLRSMRAPTLICHGTRDPFGTSEDVSGYQLSPSVELEWLEDGDHDFRARKPFSLKGNMQQAAGRIAAWTGGVPARPR